MKDAIFLLFQLLTTIVKLIQPGGSRSVIADNLLFTQQLIIHSRFRHRAPNLTTGDRTVLGFLSLLLNPRRLARSSIIIKPSTVLRFHNALKKRKYRLLYSPGGGKKPGPKGPSKEVINATLGMKQRNPRYSISMEAAVSRSVPIAGSSLKHEFAMDSSFSTPLTGTFGKLRFS